MATEELKVGDPGTLGVLPQPLLIRKKFIKAAERQKTALFLCPNKPEQEITEGGRGQKKNLRWPQL